MSGPVLVARLDSMGDVLISGPAIRAVAHQADVVMLCGPLGAGGAALLPGIDRTIVWEAPWISEPWRVVSREHTEGLISAVRETGAREAVILTSFHQSPLPLAMLLRLAGVERITGASVDHAGSLLDVRLRPGEDLPEALPEPERALAIAEAAGFPSVDDGRLAVVPTPDTRSLTGAGPYVAVHAGAAVPARRWPVQHFARLAHLLHQSGRTVVLTGSAGEAELTARIRAEAPRAIDLAGACTTLELAGVLAGADVLVSGNSGPAHLAAAVGTPIVSLFSPVVPAVKWAPYGVPVRLLGDQDAGCKDSRARECPIPGHPCLAGVMPETVLAAVEDLEPAGRQNADMPGTDHRQPLQTALAPRGVQEGRR
ncbi:glycosyltransferase family 9 protein [Leucobacter sp. NPDC077196]|uniref:glycosyltransferase family 9 protein n=1 Tax=Leucobacter sp. NPDC077196 TaxID=3154959 RepID=UPI003419D5B2